MLREPLHDISWAYQLHYYLCFRTHYRHNVFTSAEHDYVLQAALNKVCERSNYHLLKSMTYPDHLRCLVSLQPSQAISRVMETIKTNTSRIFNGHFGLNPPLWGRGYLARSVGHVRLGVVKRYISEQAEHHGYDNRARPPVYRYTANNPIILTAAHSIFDLNHHLVFSTSYRRGVFDSELGREMVQYWLRVAATRNFSIDRVTTLPDHIHLLVRTTPQLSIEECALALLNNGEYFVGRHAPGRLVQVRIEQLWQSSAYAGTIGSVTTALVKKFLSREWE